MYQRQFSALAEHHPIADRSLGRIINQRAVLDKIYQERGISKAKLAKDLGISKPAVSSYVSDLISIGLVHEKGMGEASARGGRKPTMLFFNPCHSYMGVIDLSLQTPACVVFDLECHIIGLEKIIMSRTASKNDNRQCIEQAFSRILDEAKILKQNLGVIIISQPGMISESMDTQYTSRHHYPWTELKLKPFLQQRFGVPVIIKNDVNLAAVGEMRFGTAVQLRNLLYVCCGLGLGAGLVIDGKLYEGSNNAAGEIGMMLLSNGNHLEEKIAADGLVDRAQKLYAANGKAEHLTFPLIVERLKSGDSLLEQAVYEIGWELGRIIQNCAVLLDIPTIIFGGEYLELGSALIQGMRDFLDKTPVARLELIPSTLAVSASLYGGSVIGQETILSALVGGENQEELV